MQHQLKIVAIKQAGGSKLLINESDFDPSLHELWQDIPLVADDEPLQEDPVMLVSTQEQLSIEDVIDNIPEDREWPKLEAKPEKRAYRKKNKDIEQ